MQFLESKSRANTAIWHEISQLQATAQAELLQIRQFGEHQNVVRLKPWAKLHRYFLQIWQVIAHRLHPTRWTRHVYLTVDEQQAFQCGREHIHRDLRDNKNKKNGQNQTFRI